MSSVETNIRLAQHSPTGVEWLLKRNCSLTPSQLWLAYGLACTGSLAVAGLALALGASLVLPFVVVELTALAAAFLWYARHATDRERIQLTPCHLVVEREHAGRLERRELDRAWVRVDPAGVDGLVALRSAGETVTVGRYLRAELRPVLARELRRALSGFGGAGSAGSDGKSLV